jgi:hypothetical protein
MLTLDLNPSNSGEPVSGKVIINVSTNFVANGTNIPDGQRGTSSPSPPPNASPIKDTLRPNPTTTGGSSSSRTLSSFEDHLGPLPPG